MAKLAVDTGKLPRIVQSRRQLVIEQMYQYFRGNRLVRTDQLDELLGTERT